MKEKLEKKLNLPNHDKDIEKALNIIEKVNSDIKIYNEQLKIEIPEHKKLKLIKTINIVLEGIGIMSISRFNARQTIEDYYTTMYKNHPYLGKTLYLQFYEELHKPFDRIKNKCFNILDKLDPLPDDLEEID